MQKWITGGFLCLTLQACALFGVVNAAEFNQEDLGSNLSHKHLPLFSNSNENCIGFPGSTGPTGPTGPIGAAGSGFEVFASYWLTNQQTLSAGQNVLFNVQQTNVGILYNTATGVFSLEPGVYTINYFASPNTNFTPTLNLVINGSTIPNPNIGGASIVIALTAANNSVALQATSSWTPFADMVSNGDTYYAAFASIAINKIGN